MVVASTEVLDALKSIGLNLYERKIFVSLLAKGISTAAEVSELANVPRSRSYDILESLAEKGFVVVQPSKPIKYVALGPKEALEKTKHYLTTKHKEKIDRIDRLLDSDILKKLDSLHKAGIDIVQPHEMTGTLKGGEIINRQLRSIFKEAKKDINIVTTEKGVQDLYSNHFRILKKVAKSGIKLKIAAPFKDKKIANEFSKIAEVKNIKSPLGRFCTIDDEHVVLALTDDKSIHESQDVVLWARSKHMARDVIKPHFQNIWTRTKK